MTAIVNVPKAFVAALLSAAICLCQTPATAPQTSVLAGAVASLAGEPLKSVTLHLQALPASGKPSQPLAYATSSDTQGNFLFENIDPARYTLSAERNGYLRLNYSANSRSASSVLDLSSGQQIAGIAVKMTPQAVIAGRVTNQDGEPFPSVRVWISHWVYAGGHKRLEQVDGVLTDADGSFSAGNLAAGSYYLSGSDQSSNGVRELRGRAGPVETYVTTYYPGVTDPAGAVAVQVAAGAVARGLDIRMRRTIVYRITGRLIDSNSPTPPASANIFLNPKDTSNVAVSAQATYRDGKFEFSGVPPGVYVLQATVRPVIVGNATTGRQIVTVGNGDIEGMVVRLGQGVELKGRIATEVSSASPPAVSGPVLPIGSFPLGPALPALPTVNLISVDDSSPSGGAQTKEDGTFAFTGVSPGLYQVTVGNAPPGTYVKSIRFGGQDVTRTALDFTSSNGGPIDILLSPNAGDVSGVVHDPSSGSNRQPLSGVTVTLWIPGIPAEGTIDFTRTQNTDINGQFKFPNLPPGEYRIAAWEQIDSGLGVVPEFRSKFDSKATAVKLNERDRQTIDPVLISRDEIEAAASKLR